MDRRAWTIYWFIPIYVSWVSTKNMAFSFFILPEVSDLVCS